MTTAQYLKVKTNRDRFDVISGQIKQAQGLLDMVMGEPQGSEFEVRPAYASPAVMPIPRNVIGSALRQYLKGKEDVLEQIQVEFSEL